ncbi:MAG: glycosyltransferase [Anaerolineales bacterium]
MAQIIEAHKEKPIDMFFSYFYSACARPEAIRAIADLGIVTVNWYCNASYQFHLIEELAPAYDYCLVPEKYRLDDYLRIGANPIYSQEAANPNIYRPHNIPRDFNVTFVGQKYGERESYIRYLLDQNVDIHVWGLGWSNPEESLLSMDNSSQKRHNNLRSWRVSKGFRKFFKRTKSLTNSIKKNSLKEIHTPVTNIGRIDKYADRFHPPLPDEELIRIYSRSNISLGFSTVGNTHLQDSPIKQIRLRDFEAPMSGAFYMVEYMEDLEEFFIPGKEIVCYHDEQDLTDKIKYYLAHNREREGIRQAGYKRAISEHTWQLRFTNAFRIMGLIS